MKRLRILCLYPDEMNLYGDMGNVLALRKRLEWRDIGCDVIYHYRGEAFPRNAIDIVVGGGGQDSAQRAIRRDLLMNATAIKDLADDNVPMLMVCGLYQLFGRHFITSNGDALLGLGIFDIETIAKESRLIGEITIQTAFGTMEGYENHSGQTRLLGSQQAMGAPVKGYGNNAHAKDEGAIYKNVFGTYLHGAVLPRNPHFADALLTMAMRRKYGIESSLSSINKPFV